MGGSLAPRPSFYIRSRDMTLSYTFALCHFGFPEEQSIPGQEDHDPWGWIFALKWKWLPSDNQFVPSWHEDVWLAPRTGAEALISKTPLWPGLLYCYQWCSKGWVFWFSWSVSDCPVGTMRKVKFGSQHKKCLHQSTPSKKKKNPQD